MKARYESLKAELDFAREQSAADADAVVAMTTRLDDAEAERQRLEQDRQQLLVDAEASKSEIQAKKEHLEKEVTDLQRQRSVWAREAEETAELREQCNNLLTAEVIHLIVNRDSREVLMLHVKRYYEALMPCISSLNILILWWLSLRVLWKLNCMTHGREMMIPC